jgi:hypothetical protein
MVEKISSYSQVASLVVTLGEGGRELGRPFLLFSSTVGYEELKQICL